MFSRPLRLKRGNSGRPEMDDRSLQQQRQTLRQQALQRRARLAEAAGEAAAAGLKRQGLRLLTELSASMDTPPTVAGYVPVRGEIDVMELLHALHARGHTLALPVVARDDAPLIFRRWQPGMTLERGRFGIPVPPAHAPQVMPHILLVPLAAFDAAGHRLGYGGGYYDRTLAHLRARATDTPYPPIAIGCAFAGQALPHIPALRTDAPLDWIITERSIIHPEHGQQGSGAL